MSEDQRYSKFRRCPKCGTAGVGSTFHPDVNMEMRGALMWTPYRFGKVSEKQMQQDREEAQRYSAMLRETYPVKPRMVRECFNCRHTWHEIPLDGAGDAA